MTRKQKRDLIRILLAAGLFLLALLLPLSPTGKLVAFLVCYGVIGWDILWRALRNIAHGQVFDENFLMTVATLGAMALGDYKEGVVVMLFYQVGELFQSYAVNRSRRSIAGLMDICPDHANLLRDGQVVEVSPEEVVPGDTILVRPGERLPLDGVIVTGDSSLDTSALTGESLPRHATVGDEVFSGCINQSGALQIQVTKAYEDSTVAKILDLVENASSKKSHSEAFITRFARVYTPAVVMAAVLLALLPPLLTGGGFAVWIHRALTFLVISCPCALVISVPLSFFGGIGGASKCGVLMKGGGSLETLANTGTVVFDKTGTLTRGDFQVTRLLPNGVSPQDLLETAALAEQSSTHPISRSILTAYGKPADPARLEDLQEIPGRGVRVTVDGRTVLAGNARLLQEAGISFSPSSEPGTLVYIARDGVYLGVLVIEDTVKEDAAAAISALKGAGVRQTVMLTGDTDAVGRRIGRQLGLDQVYTQLLPGDKVEKLEALLNRSTREHKVAYVGDGINDAPALARADVGIAMGGLGSDAAIEAADVVIMTDQPSKIATAMAISRKTLRIVRQNIILALGVKGVVLILGAIGWASMWAAVFADVGVAVIAICNAIRALHPPKGSALPDTTPIPQPASQFLP